MTISFILYKSLLILQVVNGKCLVYSFWPSVLISSVFGIFSLFIGFFIPLIIFICCYGRIIWVLRNRINSNLNSAGGTLTDKFQVAQTNTIKTFLLVAICFIICWSPSQIHYLLYNLGYDVAYTGIFYKFGVLMEFINCTINPFIYILKYRDYQVALREFIGCNKRNGDDESQTNISSSEITVDRKF